MGTARNEKFRNEVEGLAIQFPKDFGNKIISAELIKLVRPTAEIIHRLLTTQSKIESRIGEELRGLHGQFKAYTTKKKYSPSDCKEAFSIFIQETFNLSWARANEYICVANKNQLANLRLPISSLVELSRLPDVALEKLLEEMPKEKLSAMSYREMKALCQTRNENRRDRQSQKKPTNNQTDTHSEPTAKDAKPELTMDSKNRLRENVLIEEQKNGLEIVVIENNVMATARLREAYERFKESVIEHGMSEEAQALVREIIEWSTGFTEEKSLKKAKG